MGRDVFEYLDQAHLRISFYLDEVSAKAVDDVFGCAGHDYGPGREDAGSH